MNLTPKMTAAGMALQRDALDGATIKFTHVALGDGYYDGVSEVTQMAHIALDLTISALDKGENYVLLTCYYDNKKIPADLSIREIGIFAEQTDGAEILYAYGYDAEYPENIPSSAHGRLVEAQLQCVVSIGEAENVIAVLDDLAFFVTKEDFEAHLKAENPHNITPELIGALTMDDLNNRLKAVTITIPAAGWKEAGTVKASYAYFCDVEVSESRATLTPSGTVDIQYADIATAAGLAHQCESYNGTVRFYARNIPASDIVASIIFL